MAEREDMLELDACLGRVPMPDGLEARIVAATTLASVGVSPARRSLALGLAFAAGVALTVLALRSWPATVQSDTSVAEEKLVPSVPEARTEALVLAEQPAPGLSLSSDACEWSRSDALLRFEAGCRLRLAQPAMELEIWAPTRLQTSSDGITVRDGEVLFLVEHVEDPELPVRVGVSGGSIEVLGTRFAIRQAHDVGHVDLLEGAIRFRRLDGTIESIEPGQRYRWSSSTLERSSDAVEQPAPRAREGVDVPAPPEPASSKSALAEGLAEVARLRRAGDLEGAIAKLDELAHEQSDARTLEVISYERGTLVERSAAKSDTCEFWSDHRRRFPDGRYALEVERRIGQLECVPE